MTHVKTWIACMAIVTGFTVSLAWGATAQEEQAEDNKADITDESGRTCFWLRNITGWNSIDNRHVYVSGGGKRGRFLLTLFNYCYGIRFAEDIALNTRPTSRLCSNGNERLFVLNRSRRRQSCLISDVERVEDLKAAKLLVSDRKAAKAKEKLEESLDESTSQADDGSAFASK